MTITIRFFAQFRERLGPLHELNAPEGVPLLEVLRGIADRTPDGEAALFAADGRLRDYVIVMQNGARVDADGVELRDRDTIAVFPPVAGG